MANQNFEDLRRLAKDGSVIVAGERLAQLLLELDRLQEAYDELEAKNARLQEAVTELYSIADEAGIA